MLLNQQSQPNQNLSKNHSALGSALNDAEKSLRRAKELFSQIQKESAGPSFKDIPGIEGVFDGIYMVTKDGKKFEVPSNYAAKSLLVVGDGLKMINREGRNFFKQISKAKRKLEEGVMVKKDGKWHAITPTGSYRIVDSVIEYNKVSLNDKVLIQTPLDNPTAEYAALSKVITIKPVKETVKEISKEPIKIQLKTVEAIEPKNATPEVKPVQKVIKESVRPVIKPVLKSEIKLEVKPVEVKPIATKPLSTSDVKPAPKPLVKPATPVTPSLDDDDLR